MLTTEQVLERLADAGVTENIQMVRRWIRQGDLPAKAPAKRKDGYLVTEADLAAFIAKKSKKEKRSDKDYEAELLQLKAENARLRAELEKAERTNSARTIDLFNVLDRRDDEKKAVEWEKKHNKALELSKLHLNQLRAAEQEIERLKAKQQNNTDEASQLKRNDVEDLWNYAMSDFKTEPAEILSSAKESLFGILFKGADTANLQTQTFYISPFTGQRYGSHEKLVLSAIPVLIKSFKADMERERLLEEKKRGIEEADRRRQQLINEGKLPSSLA